MSLIPVSHIITTVDTDSFIKGWMEDPNILRTKLMWKYLIAPIFFYQYSFTLCCILSNRFFTYRGWEGGGLMSHNAACQGKTGVKKGIAGECVTWHATNYRQPTTKALWSSYSACRKYSIIISLLFIKIFDHAAGGDFSCWEEIILPVREMSV